ncbi:MAG: TonB-dependent receptor plug domain-containing protein [Terricaulis sp.]|nr:TonB-dependent receptor plug domain-containing protein [Terricaulis sp.]
MRQTHHFTAALLAASSLAFPAMAEEDEVIVTATRTATAAAALPAAVVVIDADAARARGEVTLDQALTQVPGLQAPRTGPIGQQTSIFSGGFESNHTLVLFDGVRLDDVSTPEGVFDAGQDLLGDASRIEVVQGPMSALYGSQALGGVVNVLPRRGGEGGFNPSFEAAAGSFDTLTATLAPMERWGVSAMR